jgi:hypothetical protein
MKLHRLETLLKRYALLSWLRRLVIHLLLQEDLTSLRNAMWLPEPISVMLARSEVTLVSRRGIRFHLMFDVIALDVITHIWRQQNLSLDVFVEIVNFNKTVINLMLLEVEYLVDPLISKTKGRKVGRNSSMTRILLLYHEFIWASRHYWSFNGWGSLIETEVRETFLI